MAKKKKGLRNINPGDTVEFLNYITPDHIIRAKYNTGDNGMDITDVPQNLNSYIVLGGGSGVTVEPLSVTSNGTYTAPMGKAYTPVDVNVPVPPSVTVESLSVTSNGTYTAPTGKAYSPVDVNVPATPSVTVESLSVTSNGNYTAPAGKAYSPVDVNVPQTTIESLSVTLNGTYNAPTGKAYDPVVVNVPQTTVESISITSNGTYTAPEGKAYSPIDVSVATGWTSDGLAQNLEPNGAITLGNSVTTVESRTFYWRPITSVSGSSVTTIKNYAFADCTQLLSANFPSATNINSYTFQGCTNLASVNLPEVTQSGGYVFQNCKELTEVFLPKYAYSTGSDMFGTCSKLTTVDLGSCTRIDGNCFRNAVLLDTLILRRSTVTPLNNIGAFTGTPFASGGSGGEIYVPSSLIDTYKTSTNWSTINGYGTITWKALEGSIYE